MELALYASIIISFTGGLALYLTVRQQHVMEKRADLVWWKIGYMEARGRRCRGIRKERNSYIDVSVSPRSVSVRNASYYEGFSDGWDTIEYVNNLSK